MTKTSMQAFLTFFEDADLAHELGTASNDVERAYYTQTDRVASKWHHYLACYEQHLARFRNTPVRLLEIGIFQGGSLQMWRRYLGPQAIIHAIDIDPSCAQVDEPGVTIHIASQDDVGRLDAIVAEMGGVDVVIDDGSHIWPHQIATFEALYDKVSDHGVYLCEDTHTSYWPDYRGEGTISFIDYAKGLVDKLHPWYALDDEAPDTRFARQTRSITFHDSIVAFEKQPRGRPRFSQVGQRTLD